MTVSTDTKSSANMLHSAMYYVGLHLGNWTSKHASLYALLFGLYF